MFLARCCIPFRYSEKIEEDWPEFDKFNTKLSEVCGLLSPFLFDALLFRFALYPIVSGPSNLWL